ncbi:putative dehydrogenase tr07 [Lecanicillium sp. MT-2017a]|nr:putative dehydrogenase tr07 [Lecanicillium sp. MT-2017a]
MDLTIFSAKPYDKTYFSAVNATLSTPINITYQPAPLTAATAALAASTPAVCAFVNDDLCAKVLTALASHGVRAVLLRCAGFNHVDLPTAAALGITVARVPAYSPEAVAEYAVAMIQTLNRKTHRAHNRVREGNFALDGLLGRTLHGKTVGVVGTGKIGVATAKILRGFSCRVLAHDPFPSPAFEGIGEYVTLDELLPQCDIISLHCPLMDSTRHIINAETLGKMKRGVMLVNTSRGGLIDSKAVIGALKRKQLGSLALDVYEDESSLFYDDHSGEIIHDDVLMRLMTFPNVLISGHQAFFTEEALSEIADCTLRNLMEIAESGTCKNAIGATEGKPPPMPVRTV